MSKLSTFFLFLIIYILSILVIIPFIVFNKDPRIGDLLIQTLVGIFITESIVFAIVLGIIKFIIGLLEKH